jgi:1-pyrroline-5-carboxylate dehydrogenase
MTGDPKPRIKITYATLRADNEELHAAFEAAVERVRARLGQHHRNVIGGGWRDGEEAFEVRSPIDTAIVVGSFARASSSDVDAAVRAARAAQPAWAATPWQERLRILRAAADLISERLMDCAAVMSFEAGKTRMEALGEGEEAADLIRYYARTMDENDGFDRPMGDPDDGSVHTRSILRPYGVFAVVSPFNFPMALASGPMAAALMAGNTVVFKPASATSFSAVELVRAYLDAGVPAGVLNLVMGPGATVGQALQDHPEIDGIVFTGSYEVGMQLHRSFSRRWPRPCIVEMGGKNPAIVTRHADLDEAAEGVVRAAFGFDGQKCSANSRVYVEKAVHEDLVRRVVERTQALVVGDPLRRDTFMGPVIDERAVERWSAAVSEARRDGRILAGGEPLTDGDLARGYYVEPTVAGHLPASHRLFQDELFAPFVAVHAVTSLDEAISLSNDSLYGLTAGIYSEAPDEIRRFLDEVQAGVLYVNRRAGSTTGAWPGVQSFGGWKGSGSTGKSGLGMYYMAQLMREQSHTIVD